MDSLLESTAINKQTNTPWGLDAPVLPGIMWPKASLQCWSRVLPKRFDKCPLESSPNFRANPRIAAVRPIPPQTLTSEVHPSHLGPCRPSARRRRPRRRPEQRVVYVISPRFLHVLHANLGQHSPPPATRPRGARARQKKSVWGCKCIRQNVVPPLIRCPRI